MAWGGRGALALAVWLAAACGTVGGDGPSDGDSDADAGPASDDDASPDVEPKPPEVGGGGCGDYVCGEGETCDSCSLDCFCSRVDGNGVCDTGETSVTHPADCGERAGALVATETVDPLLIQFWGASTRAGDAMARANLLSGCNTHPDEWCFRRFFSRVKNDYSYLPDVIALRELGSDAVQADVVAELRRQLDLLADGDETTQEYSIRTANGGLIAWRSARFSIVGDPLRVREWVETTGAFDCNEWKRDSANAIIEDAILVVLLEDKANADRRLAAATVGLAQNANGGTCQAENYARVVSQARTAWGVTGDLYPEIILVSGDTNEKVDMHTTCSEPACIENWRQELDRACDPANMNTYSGWYQRLHPLLMPGDDCLPRAATMWDAVPLVQRTLELAGEGGVQPSDNICSHYTLRSLTDIGQDLDPCTSDAARDQHTFIRLERADSTRIDDPREARNRIVRAKTDEGSYPAGSLDPNDHYADHRAQMTLLRW